MDREKERAENSAARESQLAGRLLGERTEALEMARAQVEILTPLSIDLPRTHLPGGRELIVLTDVVMAFGERDLFGPLSFGVRGPERIAIRGANGSGKTTLFRLLTGELKPARGEIGRRTDRIAVLDQHIGLLDPGSSILDNLRRLYPELRPTRPTRRWRGLRSVTGRRCRSRPRSLAASGCARVSPACSHARSRRSFCCSTSRPTISISRPSRSWKMH